MNIKLPSKKVKASRRDPKKLIIFGKPKAGKTTIVSQLSNCLILDLESGTDYVDAMAINLKEEALNNSTTPLNVLQNVISQLKEARKKTGKNVYKYIAVDTITELEMLAKPLAANMYRNTPMGANWVGSDVTKLPNGAGYGYLRDAFFFILNEIESVTDTVILIGHLKDKMIDKEGKEMTERALDLTGKTSRLVAADADAIGYIYREENKTMLNFAPSESLEAGARPKHLIGKQIEVATSDENGEVTVDWSKVFIDK